MELSPETINIIIGLVVAAITFVLGKSLGKVKVPAEVGKILNNKEVMQIITDTVNLAKGWTDKTDNEKRDGVRSIIKKALKSKLGIDIPDFILNYVIEKVIVKMKLGGK